ncbi:MAG: glycoside hydrolase family 30 beta sandwich domain-containing protein [Candidatus Dormiibacterota bacterium]
MTTTPATGASPGPPNPPPLSPEVNVWETTADGMLLLSPQPSTQFSAAAPANEIVTIDPTRTYQSMIGFGGSLTDSSASVLYSMSPAARAATMNMLFSPTAGDGLDFLRQPIGASDMISEDQFYTYDDMPPGQTDYFQQHFSVIHDEAEILPLLREAEQINPHLTIMAAPWSPPAWMKTTDSLIGGELIDSPQIYQSYALYLLKFLETYRDQGVYVKYISVQNEPQDSTTDTYPGTAMPSWQEDDVIEDLGPMIAAAHLGTKIIAYDHNWSEDPNDITSSPANATMDDDDYVPNVLNSPAARWIAGLAFHCYYGDPSAMTTFHNEHPNLLIMQTECSGTESADPANTFSDTLQWHARNLEIGSTRNWASTIDNWNLALNPENGPHLGGCGTCDGIVTIGPGDTVTPGAQYYALGQLSRFVQPGAVRVASTSFGTTAWNGQVMDTAFVNPDGSTVLVATNELWYPYSFSVMENGQSFNYTLQADSLVTFVWNTPPLPSPRVRDLSNQGWADVANPPGGTNPCCTGDVAANAVGDDASQRYSTDEAQAPGMYLQVDFGRPEPVVDFVLDCGASTGDYPRGYSVTVSNDGVNWSPPVAIGAGAGQITSVALDGRPVQYVRVTLTASSGNWWSVAQVRAYVSVGHWRPGPGIP